ncbi:uncharacterized protein LOC135396131 [Ornithodoros turicata]|uniref:uncharacterized protein LOC135396131 n=1 Tax=Ornithodoros turicata TaxID=34597 RepID=UPI0031387845
MALIRTCCCWKSVRRGSFASGIFTLIYFTIFFTTGMFTITSNEEEGGDHGPQTLMILAVLLAGCCVLSSILLLVGLCVDSARMLIPWICFVSITTLLEFVILFYMIGETVLDPVRASFFAVDLIVCALSVYGILCVVSQYQEYTAGRGRRDQQQALQAATVKFNNNTPGDRSNGVQKTQPRVVIKVCNTSSTTASHHLLLPTTPSATSSSVSRPSGAEVTSVSDRSPSPPIQVGITVGTLRVNPMATINQDMKGPLEDIKRHQIISDESPEPSPDLSRRHSEREPLLDKEVTTKKNYKDNILRSHLKRDMFAFQKSSSQSSTRNEDQNVDPKLEDASSPVTNL